jgi:hypothetical protein
MTWLKKFGLAALKIIGIAIGEFPLLNQSLGSLGTNSVLVAVENDITKIWTVITTAEQMFTPASVASAVKMGTAKLQATTPFVSAIVQSSTTFKGKSIKNQTLYKDAITRFTAAAADIANAYGE